MKLTIQLTDHSYDVIIEEGCIYNVSRYVNLKRNIFIITDTGVPHAIIDSLHSQFKSAYVYTLEAGEQSKNFENYENILKKLLELNFTRKDLIIAVGGGVVGDLSGFVAASYMRGIDFINIPTTSLSQIDSSIGGKVGINLNQVKNIVGAFYHPKLVLIDPSVLKTLPKRHLYNGLVEAIKAGLIYDSSLFEIFEQDDYLDYLEEIIIKALLVKKAIIEKDEKEQNLRKILNFGHTIGHAIESLTGFKDLYHGECVALGMLAMIEDKHLKERVLKVFKKLDLKTEIDLNTEDLYHLVLKDKKSNMNSISIVTVNKCGEAILKEIPHSDILTYLERL